MKNALKFGFLGLALTVAFASCNNTEKKAEDANDSVANTLDSAATTLDSATTTLDSAATK